MKGLPWAKIDTDLTADPKVQRLARKNSEREYLEALGAWLIVVLASHAAGTREVDLDLDPEPLRRLQSVGLLDVDARIPEGVWEKRIVPVLEDVQAFRDHQAGRGRKGGASRAAAAVRDDRGRLLPAALSGPVQTEPSPLSGPAQTGLSGSSRPELEREVEGERESRSGGSRSSNAREITLTKAQMLAWRTFDHPVWIPVRDAWLAKGLRMPPPGPDPADAPDDPDDDTSPRSRLWRMIDQDPGNAVIVAGWIREAPGRKAGDVLQYVFGRAEERRATLAQAAALAEVEADARRDRDRGNGSAAETVGKILERLEIPEP